MAVPPPPPAARRLDPRRRLPLHAQAEALLRQLIRRKAYRQGALLPTEVTLARQLGIARNTLRAAIARLVAEGRLERRAGIGTRAVEPRVQSGVTAWHSFTREMQQKGVAVTTHGIDARWVAAPAEAAHALGLRPRTRVLRLDRVRGCSGVPVVHFRSFLHPRLGFAAGDDFSPPLYELVHARTGLAAARSLEELRAVTAPPALARALRVATGTPLLRRDRTVLDGRGRPLEFAIVHYRSDRFTLTLHLKEA